MSRRKSFADTLPRATKRRRGRTDVESTPLAIRSRIPLEPAFHDLVRQRLGRKLGKFARHIERLSVRFYDNGPRGDIVCRAKAVLSGLPSQVVEGRATDARKALQQVGVALERSVRDTIRRSGLSAARPRKTHRPPHARTTGRGPARRDDDGSLIGRRVGRGRDALERALARPEKVRRDVFVDTAAPGTSATQRRAGYGATAARNTQRRAPRATVALEDSRTEPSRKSTRKSAQRMRGATALERNQRLQRQTSGFRAAKARVRRPR
jgi:hypothetical protein